MWLEASLAVALLAAQSGAPDATPRAATDRSPEWEFAFEVYGANPPDDSYVLGIFEADRGWLHLESRYNYEDFETVSLFVGYRLSWGGKFAGSAVPMIGVLAGRTDGMAPGFELDVGWRALSLSSQSEYAFDADDSTQDFFYSWNELGWTFLDRFTVGLAGQRTQVFQQDLAVDYGAFGRWTGKRMGLTIYLFNPDRDETYEAVALDFSF